MLASTLVTAHSVTLTGLTAGATYHYRVKSRDAAGRLQMSLDNNFSSSVSVKKRAGQITSQD
jgi:hypothetical protein